MTSAYSLEPQIAWGSGEAPKPGSESDQMIQFVERIEVKLEKEFLSPPQPCKVKTG